MLKRNVRVVLSCLALSLAAACLATGCSGSDSKPKQTEAPTERETEPKPKQTEPETESETELKTNVAYTSQDRSIRITLPDSTWTVQQDADEMRVFSSGKAAMISIVHAADANAMRNLSVAESEDALKQSLTGQYPDANAFEVVEFEKLSSATIDTYEYVVKYNATSMWVYAVTYGIIADTQAYVITGTVLDDNKALLDAVQKSVESFTVLRNNVFSAMPGSAVNQNSEQQAGADAKSQLAAMTDYGSSVTLYASDTVNIRTEPSTESDASIIGSLNPGDAVTVTGESPEWFKINVNGSTGYVNKAFLVRTQVQTESENNENQNSVQAEAEMNSYVDYGTGYTYYTTTEVNLRAQPGTESGVVSSLGGGTSVTVVGETPNWFMVSVNGATGYISKSYLSDTNTYTSPEGNGTDGGDAGQGEDAGGNTDGNTGGNTGGDANTNVGPVSGTITSVGNNTIVIQGDDGNTYSINYTDAAVSTNSGLQNGLYISAMINYSNTLPNGDLYATSVNGY